MRSVIVGVADMKVSKDPGDKLVTHALGSCLGIAVYDRSKIGGMLHVMLPNSTISSSEISQQNPLMFIDTGLPLLLESAYEMGAKKASLELFVAGGAGEDKIFAIGKRNHLLVRRLLWQMKILISGQEVGGIVARNMYLEISSGKAWVQSNQVDKVLSI